MAHYFDDIFQRKVHVRRPSTPGMHVRRSSTARSIGARSDFDNSVDGDDDIRSTTNSVFPSDPDREKERTEADEHMHQYIADQLNRFKDDSKNGHYENDDEFEAKA